MKLNHLYNECTLNRDRLPERHRLLETKTKC